MKRMKRDLGVLWMLIGLASAAALVYGAVTNIHSAKGDIGKPAPWIIILAVFLPIAAGLVVFGWYAWKGEYEGSREQEAESSS